MIACIVFNCVLPVFNKEYDDDDDDGNDYIIADTTITTTPQQLVSAIADHKRSATLAIGSCRSSSISNSDTAGKTVQNHSCADIVHSLSLLN